MPAETEDPRLALVERFFQGTGSSYDHMVDVATFGIDRLWKRRIARLVPPRARRVADLACGTGISTLAIARHLPDCRVVGVELREEYLAIAREASVGTRGSWYAPAAMVAIASARASPSSRPSSTIRRKAEANIRSASSTARARTLGGPGGRTVAAGQHRQGSPGQREPAVGVEAARRRRIL